MSVYYADGTVLKVTPKRAVYEAVRHDSPQALPIPVIAFMEPKGGRIWVGGDVGSALFFVTGSEILCCSVHGVLLWRESLVKSVEGKGASQRLDRAIAQFEAQVDGSRLRESPKDILAGTDIRILGSDFFGDRPGSSGLGMLGIEKVTLQGQELRLDLKNPTGVFGASVWIDMNTKQLLKAIRDGTQVFPK